MQVPEKEGRVLFAKMIHLTAVSIYCAKLMPLMRSIRGDLTLLV